MRPAGDGAAPRTGPAVLSGRRVLLVEDAPAEQRLLATLLIRAGAEVTLECDGHAAVDTVYPRNRRAATFDAILLDLLMSPVDGAEATAKLRERGFAAPILILTSSPDPADEARCRAAGCDRFLRKPVGHEALIEAVASCLADRERHRQPAAS